MTPVNIGDFMDEEAKKRLGVETTEREIKVKDVYLIKANEENDITPKGGLAFRNKFFVVMGINDEGDLFGCVVFDSEINRDFVRREEEEFFVDIPKERYNFLSKDSKVDCRKLKPADKEKLLAGTFKGTILDDDYEEFRRLTKLSNRNSHAMLRMYNIE